MHLIANIGLPEQILILVAPCGISVISIYYFDLCNKLCKFFCRNKGREGGGEETSVIRKIILVLYRVPFV